MTTTYDETNEAELTAALVGRKILRAETRDEGQGPFGILALDDNTTLTIHGNDGCGGCSAGNYAVEQLSFAEGIITDVTFSQTDEDEQVYSIFIYTDALPTEATTLLRVVGDDGNGWYGTGFRVEVSR